MCMMGCHDGDEFHFVPHGKSMEFYLDLGFYFRYPLDIVWMTEDGEDVSFFYV